MDQEKIGKFISELRKEKELTQSQLAECIGVSSKTVSKWECGRGMPEISTFPVLCETLGISVNELLSGERITSESYTEHAEENMVTLLKDSRAYNKKRSVIAAAVPVITLTALTLYLLGSWGQERYFNFTDIPSALFIFIVTTVFLLTSGCYGDLWRSFGLAAGFGAPSAAELNNSLTAVRLAGKTLLFSGVFLALISVMICFYSEELIYDAFIGDDPMFFFLNIEVALIPVFYGMAGYLLSLPIRARLEKRINRQ